MTLKAIRNIDEETYQHFKAQAAHEGRPIGDVLTDAMKAYIRHAKNDGARGPPTHASE